MFLPFFASFITTFLLIYNIFFLNNPFWGGVFFFVYLSAHSYLADNWLKNLLPNSKIIRFLFGIFIVFYLLFTATAISITLYRVNNFIIAVIIIIVAWLLLAIYFFYSAKDQKTDQPPWLLSRAVNNFFLGLIKLLTAKFKKISFRPQADLTLLSILLTVLFLIGFYTLLASGQPKQYIITPWQAIPAQFIWVIILLSVIILGLIIYRARPLLLLPIILFSLLLHLYIPAVYQF